MSLATKFALSTTSEERSRVAVFSLCVLSLFFVLHIRRYKAAWVSLVRTGRPLRFAVLKTTVLMRCCNSGAQLHCTFSPFWVCLSYTQDLNLSPNTKCMKPNKLQLNSVRKPFSLSVSLPISLSLPGRDLQSILKCNSPDRCQKGRQGGKSPS